MSETKKFWSAPDALLAEAGAEGEWLAAKIRIIMVALLLLTPFYRYIDQPWVAEYFTGLAVTIVGWIFAVVIYFVLRNGHYVPWIGFASAILDVTLVTIALVSFVMTGPAHAGANSRVTYPIYFLAIASTALRYDRRICVTAGALAVIQYIGVVIYDKATWGFNNPKYAPYEYGRISIPDQVNRVILMIAAAILAYEIVRRAEALRRAAIKDVLTDLPNRSYAETRTQAEFSRARRYKQPMTIVAVDVDRFKSINDRFGHAAGDRVLRTISHVLRDNLRISDVVARYGGEEFMLLLPQTDREAALEKVEELLKLVEEAELPVPHKVTISAGVATYPLDADNLDDLLLEADRRLMRAKEHGRNRVISTPPLSSSRQIHG